MYHYNSLLSNVVESHEEQHFNYKCSELLKYYGEDKLIENVKNPIFFDYLFTSIILSNDDINHALLKKYYLSEHKSNTVTGLLDKCIEALDFDTANDLLTNSDEVKEEVLRIYIANINESNRHLASVKCNNFEYDEIKETLCCMDNYYINIRYSEKKENTYKKVITN